MNSVWEQNYKNGRFNEYPYDKIVSLVAHNFYKDENRNSLRVLDLGCGGGNNTFFLCEKGFSVYAVDGSQTSVELTNQYLKRRGLQANVVCGSFLDLPFESDFFDFVIDRQSISHNTESDVSKIFQELKRVLRKNGKYIGIMHHNNQELQKDGEKIGKFTYCNFKSGIYTKSGTVFFMDVSNISKILNGYKIDTLDRQLCTDFLKNKSVISDELAIVASKI